MTKAEMLHLLDDLHERELRKMGRHLANMDSRGQIGSEGNYHNGVAAGLRLAIQLTKALTDENLPPVSPLPASR